MFTRSSGVARRAMAVVGATALAVVWTASLGQAQVIHELDASLPERMTQAELAAAVAAAQPMERLRSDMPVIEMQDGAETDADAPVIVAGYAGPAERLRPGDLNFAPPETSGGGGIGTQNYGQGNLDTYLHYNDYLQVPYPVRYYPWRAAGRMFFQTSGGGWSWCSAALIAPSILVTAGHCVHDGGNGNQGWIQQGYFIPAASANVNPYGHCWLRYVGTTNQWFNIGQITQGYDVGIAVCDKREQTNREMGRITGWYGFCTENCRQSWWFLTQLGYPGNYYGGDEMTASQHVSRATEPDYVYGSGMRGGSSGGPHIANIGEIKDSSTDPGQWTSRNVIFAVTSWGYISHVWKIQGASTLSGVRNANNFPRMYNQACRAAWALHGRRSCNLLR